MPYLAGDQAAAFAGTTRRNLQRLTAQGVLTAHHAAGRTWWSTDDLASLARARGWTMSTPRPTVEQLVQLRDHGLCTKHEHRHWWISSNEAERARATLICRTCPVQAECASWAITHREPWGVWGGIDRTPVDRRSPRHRRAQQVQS